MGVVDCACEQSLGQSLDVGSWAARVIEEKLRFDGFLNPFS